MGNIIHGTLQAKMILFTKFLNMLFDMVSKYHNNFLFNNNEISTTLPLTANEFPWLKIPYSIS